MCVLWHGKIHFCQMCNPRPLYESLDDLWKWLATCNSISNPNTMTQCEDAFFKDGCNLTNTNRKYLSFFLRKGQIQCHLNCQLLNMLAKTTDKNQRNWSELFPYVMLGYRTSVQESTYYTSYFLVFGHFISQQKLSQFQRQIAFSRFLKNVSKSV